MLDARPMGRQRQVWRGEQGHALVAELIDRSASRAIEDCASVDFMRRHAMPCIAKCGSEILRRPGCFVPELASSFEGPVRAAQELAGEQDDVGLLVSDDVV